MEKNANEKKRPSHAIYQVIGEGDKARWVRIGAGWANRDGNGLFLKFDSYPVVGHIQVREFSERRDTQNEDQQ